MVIRQPGRVGLGYMLQNTRITFQTQRRPLSITERHLRDRKREGGGREREGEEKKQESSTTGDNSLF